MLLSKLVTALFKKYLMFRAGILRLSLLNFHFLHLLYKLLDLIEFIIQNIEDLLQELLMIKISYNLFLGRELAQFIPHFQKFPVRSF